MKAEQDKIVKFQTYDSSFFISHSYFNNDEAQFHLMFQPIYKTIKTFSDLKDAISEWESKRLSNEKSMCGYIANVSVCPELIWMNNTRIRLKFKGSCLKQEDKSPFTPKNVVNLFNVYELDTWSGDLNTDFTLKSCFFFEL